MKFLGFVSPSSLPVHPLMNMILPWAKSISCSSICPQDWAQWLTYQDSLAKWTTTELEGRATLRPRCFKWKLGTSKKRCKGNPCGDVTTPSVDMWLDQVYIASQGRLCSRNRRRKKVGDSEWTGPLSNVQSWEIRSVFKQLTKKITVESFLA